LIPFKAVRPYATGLLTLACVLTAYAFARLPGVDPDEARRLAGPFRFERSAFPEPAAHPAYKYVRNVQPSLSRISGWISSVGAAVALGDLDGDGISNDLCSVDPRTDLVTVAPVPGTGARYEPFALAVTKLPYDRKTMAPMGCLIGDLNEDGLPDALVYYWGRTPVAFLRTSGTSNSPAKLSLDTYTQIEIVPIRQRWFTNAALLADLDGDGHLDLVIGNYFKDGAHILDANAGGVEEMHNTKSNAHNGGTSRILRWTRAEPAPHPSVRFEEAAGVFSDRMAHGWTLGVGAADLDGDMRPELYFAHDFGPDSLLHNLSTPGHLRFEELYGQRTLGTPSSCVLGHDSFKGMGVDFADVNGDGIFDIYVSNIADRYALQESHFLWLSTGDLQAMKRGVAPYVNASDGLGLARSGWGWDARLDDFDNDGRLEAVQAMGFLKGQINRWPELQALGTGNDSLMHDPTVWPSFKPGADVSGQNHNAFFVRRDDGRFVNVGDYVGFNEPMVARGIAVADVDGDGRLDFAVANQFGPSYVFRNRSPQPGTFLGLHLQLPLESLTETRDRAGHPASDMPGRPAIGAVAEIRLPDGRMLIAQADGGSGHSGKRSPDIHFGLGKWPSAQKVDVLLRWRDPSGRLHSEQRQFAPGWHTVTLAWPAV
jgi:enediyne biosynthesis protein E4